MHECAYVCFSVWVYLCGGESLVAVVAADSWVRAVVLTGVDILHAAHMNTNGQISPEMIV